jgi:hypothetical protein
VFRVCRELQKRFYSAPRPPAARHRRR